MAYYYFLEAYDANDKQINGHADGQCMFRTSFPKQHKAYTLRKGTVDRPDWARTKYWKLTTWDSKPTGDIIHNPLFCYNTK